MIARSARIAAALAVLAACTDLSNLSGGTPDASTTPGSDGGTIPDDEAGTIGSEDGSIGTDLDGGFRCEDASTTVVYCATFDPGTALASYGLVEATGVGTVTLDPAEGNTAPGSLRTTMASRNDAAAPDRARLKRTLPNAPHIRASFSMRVSPLSEGENLVKLGLGAYELLIVATPAAGVYGTSVAQFDPSIDASYQVKSLPGLWNHDTWYRYVIDFYESENGGTASHADVTANGSTTRIDLNAHTYSFAQIVLALGIANAYTVGAEENVLFDDVVIEALPQ